MLANLHYANREWEPAQKIYDRILTNANKQDDYAMIALGNIYLENHKPKYAERYFTEALKGNFSSMYAANGLGCVLGSTNEMAAAKDVFLQVRESATSEHSAAQVWLNLAHTYVELVGSACAGIVGALKPRFRLYECLFLFLLSPYLPQCPL
jgi:tetratricopeptide (TPR) repeat protein